MRYNQVKVHGVLDYLYNTYPTGMHFIISVYGKPALFTYVPCMFWTLLRSGINVSIVYIYPASRNVINVIYTE